MTSSSPRSRNSNDKGGFREPGYDVNSVGLLSSFGHRSSARDVFEDGETPVRVVGHFRQRVFFLQRSGILFALACSRLAVNFSS